MLGVNNTPITLLKTSTSLVNHQSVRNVARRKPFWLGIAKTKIDKVPQPKIYRSEEENDEYRRVQSIYRCEMRSLKLFITTKNPLLSYYNQEKKTENIYFTEDNIKHSLHMNMKFNQKSAKFREERLKQELEDFKIEAEKKMKEIEEKEKKRKELIEEAVRLEKIKAQSYITKENLDEAIEKCLSKEEEYNFAIDLTGNRYIGKEPFIKIVEESQKLKVENS